MIQSPDDLQETIARLKGTLEATHDGILVVGVGPAVLLYNPQFLKMFGFTAETLERGGVDGVIDALMSQLQDGSTFRDAVGGLTTGPEREGLEVLRFTDGRMFEQFVAPHRVGSAIIGRVISFRDIGASTRGGRSRRTESGSAREGPGSGAHRQLGGRTRRNRAAQLVHGIASNLRRAHRPVRGHIRGVCRANPRRRPGGGARGHRSRQVRSIFC